jgi:uncharacterized protein (TIGR02596 family)
MNRRRSAFSLVELLIVVAIIGIIAGFGIPAVQGVLRGSALTQAASQLTDNLGLARQHAISRNRVVEVRFYRFGDQEVPGEKVDDPTTGSFRALQYFEINEAGIILPVGKYQRLPDTMMMNPGETLSTLLGDTAFVTNHLVKSSDSAFNKSLNPELPRGVGHKYDYVWFRFNPDGTTDLPPLGTKGKSSENGRWYITVHSIADQVRTQTNTVPPPDFFTWMIEPVSGTSKTFRPGVK